MEEIGMELKTPLYDAHVEAGGKIVPFGGYLLPVQYGTGVITEHMAVRQQAGLFDVSHMGEIMCTGKQALENLNMILTNDFTDMEDGQARYSVMCNEHGGCVDDLIVYKVADEKYFIVVNASNKDKDYAWMCDHCFGEAKFEDISSKVGQIALQGPKSKEIISKLAAAESIPEKYYYAVFDAEVAGMKCCVSQTGYTGEFGYEIYMAAEDAVKMWNALLEAGKEEGLIPCGLGARDTLRMEAAMPLYGHEMNDDINPIETGLGFAVKRKKDAFIGKEFLPLKADLTRKRVGLQVDGRGIIREEMEVFADGKKIGFTTSGTKAPFIDKAVGMAILDIDYTEIGTKVTVSVRGRDVECEVVQLPFYKREA